MIIEWTLLEKCRNFVFDRVKQRFCESICEWFAPHECIPVNFRWPEKCFKFSIGLFYLKLKVHLEVSLWSMFVISNKKFWKTHTNSMQRFFYHHRNIQRSFCVAQCQNFDDIRIGWIDLFDVYISVHSTCKNTCEHKTHENQPNCLIFHFRMQKSVLQNFPITIIRMNCE